VPAALPCFPPARGFLVFLRAFQMLVFLLSCFRALRGILFSAPTAVFGRSLHCFSADGRPGLAPGLRRAFVCVRNGDRPSRTTLVLSGEITAASETERPGPSQQLSLFV